MTSRSVLLAVLLCVFARSAIPADGNQSDGGCTDSAPLLSLSWPTLPLVSPPEDIGEWQLPISASRPDVVTQARVQVVLTRSPQAESGWQLEVRFSFPDPKPFGIPFTFQKVELSWDGAAAPLMVEVDWTDSCSQPGRPYFPRQPAWSAVVALPETEGVSMLKNPVFKLWGSRN